METTKYIATISGGKDSVTMVDLLLKNGHKVDEIIFTDTLKEFDLMYQYLEKVNNYFKARYNKEIVFLKPDTTFEDWAYGTITRGERKGKTRGIPTINTPCYWRRESKSKPMEKYVKEKYKNCKINVYIGYTLHENRNVQDTEVFNYIYPLKTIFKMTEEDCKQYLIKQEMENPLYRFFIRTGCFLCPFQSEKAFYEIWLNFPKEWNEIRKIENHLKNDDNCVNKFFFVNHRTCDDMEKLFKGYSKNLFGLSDEPLKDCFCKI